jgi:single-stranded-DNA-specific exonuclease
MQNPLATKILTKSSIEKILLQRFSDSEYNSLAKLPKPNELKDMQKATDRIIEAINKRQKILVVGDYDVDGVVSTTLMIKFFEAIDYPIEWVIPNRFRDGYGLSINLVKDKDCELIITVDNGISAYEACEYCKEKSIDIVITDHHTPSEKIPHAYAIVNQKQKDCSFPIYEICGAQIAWYLIASLNSTLNAGINIKALLSIVSIAIIADVMPLTQINRTMVRTGLKEIQISANESLMVLKDSMKKNNLTSEDIAFYISPKLNSAGRMSDASLAVEFLTSHDYDEAYSLFERLNSLNEQRKEIESEITNKAIDSVDEGDIVTVVWGEDWHEGVIGIVASKLVDKYQRPAIVFSIEGNKAKASARSIADVNIYNLIADSQELLLGFGGHKSAAGLAIEPHNLDKFKALINQKASLLDKSLFVEENRVLGEIDITHIDLELLSILERFEPYGEANERPKFRLSNANVHYSKKVGKDANHLKFDILDKKTNSYLSAIKFKTDMTLQVGEVIDFSFSITKNEFNGVISPSLMVDDIY